MAFFSNVEIQESFSRATGKANRPCQIARRILSPLFHITGFNGIITLSNLLGALF